MYIIEEQLISNNRSYKTLSPIGMVVHCTDTSGASAQNERDAFNNHPEFQASAHMFIDANHIIQTVPVDERAWHAGPTANSRYLGVELCMANSASEFQEIWNRALWAFSTLMVSVVGTKTITPDNVLSHAEVSQRFGETDHMDPVDYFAKYGKTVDMFRSEVQAAINGGTCIGSGVNTTVSALSIDSESLKLQKVLNSLKMKDGKGNPLEEDGVIGTCTKQAIKRFQTICGLTVDGIAGGQTWGVINDILSRPVLEVGSRGVVVRYLQGRIGCSCDGIFGWDTNRHVVIWQGQNFCSQDGIVGPATWSKMIG